MARNRAEMPLIAVFVDQVRAEFGDITVTYARENGIERGKVVERGLNLTQIVIFGGEK